MRPEMIEQASSAPVVISPCRRQIGAPAHDRDIGRLLQRGEQRSGDRLRLLHRVFVMMNLADQPVPAAHHEPPAAIGLHRLGRIQRFHQHAVLAIAADLRAVGARCG